MTFSFSGIAVLADASTAIRARKASPVTLYYVQHKDGIWWFDAPLPRRWHKCKTHTIALLGTGLIRRCRCGAISWNGGMWIEKNSERNNAKSGKADRTKNRDIATGISRAVPKHSAGNQRVDS